MSGSCRRLVLLFLVAAFAVGSTAMAASLEQFNLGKLSQRADKIFRGTVLSAVPGSVEAGGGQIPTMVYTLRVDEAFKGTFNEVKGQRLIEIRMLGKQAPAKVGNAVRMAGMPELPELAVGSDYLLFSSRASRIGLASTIGLGQGCFRVLEKDGATHAVNGFNNIGLFKGLDTEGVRLPVEGPVSYSLLADRIRAELGR